MPVEIKELHIKVTVPVPPRSGADVGDLFLFQAAPPLARDGMDAAWPDDGAPDILAPDPGPVDAAPAVRHTGGVNVALADGSVRSVSDGFDLFG